MKPEKKEAPHGCGCLCCSSYREWIDEAPILHEIQAVSSTSDCFIIEKAIRKLLKGDR